MPDLRRDVEQVVHDALIVLYLDYDGEDILDYRCQLPELGVVELGLRVEVALEFVQEVMRPSHLLEDQAPRFLELPLVLLEVRAAGEEAHEVVNQEFLFFIRLG